ncbi:YjbF family lipoprotein [Alteromonas sp. C1M14]|uniref:YjbF family lipoprotein n=1 Tax=Alteromonas sp. C1M14 TaxID=2841567 RepID=UPI001C0845DD|nr:YjbF family lipoprotein [Alteromonas sp. C1M14]MBU2979835.1 YjbF family lipoprotein [Alteromonas sp. C1M14]
MFSCSSTNKAYYDTLKLAFTQTDNTVSAEQIRQSRADLLGVTHGERAQVIMALAFIEDNAYKWVSADHAILTMHYGLITHTYGFENDSVYHQGQGTNPLADSVISPVSWTYTTDIEHYGYGLDIETQWQRMGDATINILDHDFAVYMVEESVTYPQVTPYIDIHRQWTNRFWFSKENGELLQSEQQVSPVGEPLKMVFLSRAQRLIDEVAQ